MAKCSFCNKEFNPIDYVKTQQFDRYVETGRCSECFDKKDNIAEFLINNKSIFNQNIITGGTQTLKMYTNVLHFLR